jgi:hypothetical protein
MAEVGQQYMAPPVPMHGSSKPQSASELHPQSAFESHAIVGSRRQVSSSSQTVVGSPLHVPLSFGGSPTQGQWAGGGVSWLSRF